MSHRPRLIAAALALGIMTPGCATILNGNRKTIFLHMSEADATGTTFYLDGKPAPWSWRTYSMRETGRSGDVVYTQTTRLPALTVSSPARYVTLTAEFADGSRREILLKRDLMRGYKFYLRLDYMTFGIGTLIDIYGSGLYGMNEVSVSAPTSAVVGGGQP